MPRRVKQALPVGPFYEPRWTNRLLLEAGDQAKLHTKRILGDFLYPTVELKGQYRGLQIGPMSLKNIPEVQRNKQKDICFSGMFNYI
jgi:hypothetical protein